ncbi:hypothetical protein U6G28_02755 [Actinomycetaceae bacterium MB13-C1-2]|nr:hypothetical protein U6G28_02755 [Actinomycetaceae bacterium MB13-C1-2]
MQRRRFRFLLTEVVTVVVAISACSSSSGDAAEEFDPGLLWSELTFLTDGPDLEELKAQAVEEEELMAQCMKKEGFEYIPTNRNVSVYSAETVAGWAQGTLEFAQQYGYGIVNSPWFEESIVTSQETDYSDPNADYFSSLSSEEQQTYWLTLYGEGDSPEDIEASEDGEYVYDWTKFGCFGWAQNETTKDSPYAFYEDPEFSELVDAIGGVWDTVRRDPEMETLEAEWSSCMLDAGYEGLETRGDASRAMRDKYDVLSGCSGNTCMDPPKDKKREFQEEEIKQAVDDFSCAEEVHYDTRLEVIDDRIQKELIERYRPQIDAAILKYGEKK